MTIKEAIEQLKHLAEGSPCTSIQQLEKDIEAVRVLDNAVRNERPPLKKFEQVNTITNKIVERFFLPDDPSYRAQYFLGLTRLHDPHGEYKNLRIGEKIRFTGQTYLRRVE
jgi:hypothetical protein